MERLRRAARRLRSFRTARTVGRLVKNSRSLRAYWDFPWDRRPELGSYITRDRRVVVAGWALATEGTPQIDVRVDGKTVERFPPTQYREDVAIMMGHSYPSARELTGWARAIDVSRLSVGRHRFAVSVSAGGESISLGSRTIDVTPPDDPDRFLASIHELLRPSASARATRGHQVYVSGTPDGWLTQPTSVWGFSGFAQDQMRVPGARVLVVGSGIGVTVPNVIQLDVTDYPNIDVISDAPELPFVDAAFDAVICENVIEHVPSPFSLVDEIHRVLKCGGRLGINGTNMHFTHGFPSHYFNPTEFGMRHLLDARFTGDYGFMDITQSLGTVLEYLLGSLPARERHTLEGLTIGELLAAASSENTARAALAHAPDMVRRAVSTNIYFAGEKK